MRAQTLPFLRWFFTLLTIEWGLALVLILSRIRFFKDLASLALPKLIFILILVGLVALLGLIMWGYWRGKNWSQQQSRKLTHLVTRDKLYWWAIIISYMGLAISLVLLLAYRSLIQSGVENLFIAPYLEFSLPIIFAAFLTAIQLPIAIRLLRYGTDVSIFRQYHQSFKVVLVSLLILVLLGVIIAAADLGLKPDAVGWGTPGVPILSIQVLIVLVFSASVWYLSKISRSALQRSTRWNADRFPPWLGDLLISVFLWGTAVLIWGLQPVKPTYFSPAALPPNFEIYPNSDSVHYALDSVKLLIGSGYDVDAIRPLYVLFLALAQSVSGLEYQHVVMWQVVILAAIPVFGFLLGKSLHHRFTGVLVGVFLILREFNALSLAGEINTAHAKLIMADLPITLLVIAYTLIIVRWLQDPGSRKMHPLLAGGILALAMLIRVQVAVLLPVSLLLVLAYFWRKPSLWLKNGFLLTASTLVVLSPWLLRTWQVSGMFGLSEMANTTQANLINQRYSLELQGYSNSKAGKTEGEYTSGVISSALDFSLQHPGIVAEFVANHFMHNQIASLLVLPASLDLVNDIAGFDKEVLNLASQPGQLWRICCSEQSYVRALPFWKSWDGTLDIYRWIPVLISTVLLAVGVGIAANKWQLVGLIPLLFLLAYSLSNAIFRNSGWRYILPVDWASILYYAIGISQLSAWIVTFFANRLVPRSGLGLPEKEKASVPSGKYFLGKAAAILVGFTLIAAALPVIERVVPDRYADTDPYAIITSRENRVILEEAGFSQETIQSILDRPDHYLTIGMGMYPRFFEANQGENGTGSPDVIPTADNRLIFYLANTNRDKIALPMSEPPAAFANQSDVLVIGCQQGKYILAELVMVLGESSTVLDRTPESAWRCSSPNSDAP